VEYTARPCLQQKNKLINKSQVEIEFEPTMIQRRNKVTHKGSGENRGVSTPASARSAYTPALSLSYTGCHISLNDVTTPQPGAV
jgi:hypothetical protein